MNPADVGFRILGAAGVPTALARRLAPLGFIIALLIALAVFCGVLWAGWSIFDRFNDRAAVESATNEANADFRGRQVTAERTAGAAKEDRDSTNAAESRALQETIDEADAAGSSAADAVWNSSLFDN